MKDKQMSGAVAKEYVEELKRKILDQCSVTGKAQWALEMLGLPDTSDSAFELEVRRLAETVTKLRFLLFLRHGCVGEALYGDDGELQCKVCGIDFRRMSGDEIERTWLRRAMEKYAKEKAAGEKVVL